MWPRYRLTIACGSIPADELRVSIVITFLFNCELHPSEKVDTPLRTYLSQLKVYYRKPSQASLLHEAQKSLAEGQGSSARRATARARNKCPLHPGITSSRAAEPPSRYDARRPPVTIADDCTSRRPRREAFRFTRRMRSEEQINNSPADKLTYPTLRLTERDRQDVMD